MQVGRHKRLLLIVIGFLVTYVFCMTPKIAVADENQPAVREHLRWQIRDGKTKEALQANEKLIKYYTAKFQPVSIYGYVEKSGEAVILHVFIDYKDIAAYTRIKSQRVSDAEWKGMYQVWFGTYVEGTLHGTLLTSHKTFFTANPVANLSQGQEGKIFFSTENFGTFRNILAGEGQSKPVTISGTLKMPKEVGGKVPAVIILHSAAGVIDHYFEVADMLNEMGIAAFIVDSFEPRGITLGVDIIKKLFHSYSTRISDAYAAMELLSTHPKIDKLRIAVMGYAHGAAVALFVASEKIRWSFIADDLRFAASIAYYPNCFTQFKDIDFTDAPVLMLLAEKDNICPVKACLDYAQRIKDSGAEIKVIVYKGAHHDFPVHSGNKIIKVPSLSDWSNCKQEDYLLLLQDEGNWFFPHRNKTLDEVNGEYTANCRVDGEAIVGGNEEAKAKSIDDFKKFFKRVFNID